MAIVREQFNSGQGSGSESGANVAFSSNVKAGSLLIMLLSSYVATGTSYIVTDNNGNTWSEVYDNEYQADRVGGLAYAYNANAGPTTVTVTTDGSADSYTIVIVEVSGIQHTSDPLDQSNQATATSASWDSGNVTTTQADEYIIGVMAVDNGDQTLTEDGAFTLIFEEETGSTQMPISVGERIVSSTLTESYSGTIGASSAHWAAIATFKGKPTRDISDPELLDTSTSTTNNTTIQSGSITPTADALLIAIVYSRTSAGSRTITGVTDTLTGTSSWTIEVQTVGTASGFANIAICTAKAGSSPGSGTVTATLSDNSARKIMHVFEVTGEAGTPIVQTASGTSSATTLSFSLGRNPSVQSCVIGAVNQASDTATDPRPGSNYTELVDTSGGFGAGNIRAHVEYDRIPDGTTVNWSNLHANNNAGVAIEITPPFVPIFLDYSESQTTLSAFSSGTISPSPNALLLCFVGAARASNIQPLSFSDSFTGTGSWNQVEVTSSAGAWYGTIGWAITGSSPGSGTVTVTHDSSDSNRWVFWTYELQDGFNSTTPVVNTKSDGTQSGTDTPSLTLDATPASDSHVYGHIYARNVPGQAIIPGTNFTELGEDGTGAGANDAWAQVEYDPGSATTTVDWSGVGTSWTEGCLLAIEVQAEAAAGGGSHYPLRFGPR